MVAHNFVQVNHLWRGIAERFLYSALYVEEEWRLQRFIDTVKQNPNLAEQLRTLVIMPPSDVEASFFNPLVVQVLGLCHGIVAIVVRPYLMSNSLHLCQFPDSSRRLQLLSTKLSAFMMNFNSYSSLQVLELSVGAIGGYAFPSFPDHITFPFLHTLILKFRDIEQLALNIIGMWELPSLKALSISRWILRFSIALLPLIQRSYERLEFFDTSLNILHDRAFHDIIRTPPFHLRNISFDLGQFTYPPPPMYPATNLFFGNVTTLGIRNFQQISPETEPAWVQFFSDPTYMPHLRSVLTDMTKRTLYQWFHSSIPLLDILRSFEKVLEERGVVFKGVMDDYSSFVPIELLRRDILKVSMSLFSNGSMLISSPVS